MNREPQALFHQHFVLDGAYELSSSLAHTKRSVVYKARPLPTAPIQDYFQTDVALKLLLHDRSLQGIENAEHEAKMLDSVHSPHVVTLLDYVARKDICYLVYQFSSGGDLGQLLSRTKTPLPLERVIFFARQLLSGLADIHREGIVHCDIKPGNLLLSDRDELKISDFGLAKFAAELQYADLDSLGVGTFEYLAPEALQFGSISYSCDIYAAGVTIFELLTGHRPVETECFAAGISACLNAEYAKISDYRDDISADFEEVILRALAVDPAQRFASAAEFLDALLTAAQPLLRLCDTAVDVKAEEEGFTATPQRRSYTQNALVAACFGCVLALLLVLETYPGKVDAQAPVDRIEKSSLTKVSALEENLQAEQDKSFKLSKLPDTPSALGSLTTENSEVSEYRLGSLHPVRADGSEVTRPLFKNAFVGVLASESFSASDSEGYIQVATLPVNDSIRVFVSFDEGESVLTLDHDESARRFTVNGQEVLLRFVSEGNNGILYLVLIHQFGEDRIMLLPYRRV